MLPLMLFTYVLFGTVQSFPHATQRHVKWAEAGLDLISQISCEEVLFGNERDCRELIKLSKNQVIVYAAMPVHGKRHIATMPDGVLGRSSGHDGVLVLDPFPEASFGHLVLVFYVDIQTAEHQCNSSGGHYLSNGDCMRVAQRNRCLNLAEKSHRRKSGAPHCELLFLPLVQLDDAGGSSRDARKGEQRLHCVNDIPGFAPCPELRPLNETSKLVCNPLDVNTKRCSTTHETVRTRCRVFETCDQALILAGGWNRDHSPENSKCAVHDMFHTFRKHGFARSNVKVFYANGAKGIDIVSEDSHAVFPAAMKFGMRYHLNKMCSSAHCVDSLVVYLNSPTKNDGTMLLWDVDGNGEADETEVYTVKEFLMDLETCEAKRVFVIVDQSFSGPLLKALSRSNQHSNVMVYANGKDEEYSWNREFTRQWVNAKHMHTCAHEVQEHAVRHVLLSTPTTQDGSDGTIRTTIFGAPCDVVPPFSRQELENGYLGCQNLPTRIWISKFMSNRRSITE